AIVDKGEVVQLIDDLITDVGGWFRDPVVHVGHDEVNLKSWGDIDVKAMMRRFETELVGILEKNGKQYAGWDEIADVSFDFFECILTDVLHHSSMVSKISFLKTHSSQYGGPQALTESKQLSTQDLQILLSDLLLTGIWTVPRVRHGANRLGRSRTLLIQLTIFLDISLTQDNGTTGPLCIPSTLCTTFPNPLS
ncbi:hypothetical protein HDU99_010002, partial [Rhizoclosmatium hyalinum]